MQPTALLLVAVGALLVISAHCNECFGVCPGSGSNGRRLSGTATSSGVRQGYLVVSSAKIKDLTELFDQIVVNVKVSSSGGDSSVIHQGRPHSGIR